MMGVARRAGRVGRAICVVAVAVSYIVPTGAIAAAWTEPQGEGLVIETLSGWTGAGAPWGGDPAIEQKRVELETYAEYGLDERWTIFGQMGIERESLSPPSQSSYFGPDYSDIGMRVKLWTTGDWVFSGEMAVLFPGATYPRSPAEAGDTGGAVEGRALAGWSFEVGSVPGFLDVELAYRDRAAGPPSEGHADVTLGLKPAPGAMVMVQSFSVVSLPSSNPSFPSWRQEIFEISMVVPLADVWSLQFGWFTTLRAVRTNTERGLVLALWRRF
jgi:hypothetical protein